MYDWELTLNRMVFDISVRERSELSSQFYFVANRSSYSRKTADSHTWLELNSRKINVLLCPAACQQRILLDSLGRDLSTGDVIAFHVQTSFCHGSSGFVSISYSYSSPWEYQFIVPLAEIDMQSNTWSNANVNTAENMNNSQRVKQQVSHVDWQLSK